MLVLDVLEDSLIGCFNLFILFDITISGLGMVDLVGDIFIFDVVNLELLVIFSDQNVEYAKFHTPFYIM